MLCPGISLKGQLKSSSPAHAAVPSPAADGRQDFDFFAGRWDVTHRRLRERLAGCTAWEWFAGTCEMRTIVGGLCNVDDSVLELPAGTYRAATVRVFNPMTRLWSIWWIDGRDPSLEPPVHGLFVWSAITARSARWEQAFSADGGASWEDNRVMGFERAAS